MATTGYYTLTQMVNAKLASDKGKLDTARIQDLILRHMKSQSVAAMRAGVNYYATRHDIYDHKNIYYVDAVAVEDTLKANNTLPHPFHKILVDQKVAYIAGKPIVVAVAEPDRTPPEKKGKPQKKRAPFEPEPEPTPEETEGDARSADFESALHDYLDNEWDDTLTDWIRGASNKGVEWLHFYISPEQELEYVICPAEEIIPVYDSQYQDDLLYVIRFYTYELIDERGGLNVRYKVEWWSKTGVEYWVQNLEQNFILDTDYTYNPASHWYSFNTAAKSGTVEGHAWEVVPFVPLYNNSDATTDLNPIKELIDAYDKVVSGWCNDLQDFQEMVYVLKGYAAVTTELQKGLSELAVFMQNLKTHKVISVDADGAVETLKAEIPVEAKEKFLAITRKAIFYFGQGVDVDNENFDTASGVALKFLYSGLDLKAADMIRKLKTALTEAMSFFVQWMNLEEGTDYDAAEVIFTVNKSMIFNEKEKIDSCTASAGTLSEQTILENHPWVDDVEQEMERKEAEKAAQVEKSLVSLENIQPDGTMVEPDGTIKAPPVIVPQNGNGKKPAPFQKKANGKEA